ncbi:hypothetical protein HWB91_gp59 [Bacillus phage vB_BboS-125]|uniref:Uncharacterized protein n=1 Tax=Bacillus phage vB_BboS-125 TaxID=2419618 RepID=A0A3G3BVY5_9CAUD|nr:hypothetical protein HWB91_gp59 [Bacillus phage vB_BboS-125]AYP68429.1 hypothetical protein BboS125_00060 [Bacillus phage vB_BboS-125]
MNFAKFKEAYLKKWPQHLEAPGDEELFKLFLSQVVIGEWQYKEMKKDRRTAKLADIGKPLEPRKEPAEHPGFNRCNVDQAEKLRRQVRTARAQGVDLPPTECNVCGNDPEYIDWCTACNGRGYL